MSTKLNYAGQMQGVATRLALAISAAKELTNTYFDRGYNTGPNVIVDADVSSLGILAADVASMVTLMQQLANFEGNLAVTTGAYGVTLDKLRTDI